MSKINNVSNNITHWFKSPSVLERCKSNCFWIWDTQISTPNWKQEATIPNRNYFFQILHEMITFPQLVMASELDGWNTQILFEHDFGVEKGNLVIERPHLSIKIINWPFLGSKEGVVPKLQFTSDNSMLFVRVMDWVITRQKKAITRKKRVHNSIFFCS